MYPNLLPVILSIKGGLRSIFNSLTWATPNMNMIHILQILNIFLSKYSEYMVLLKGEKM